MENINSFFINLKTTNIQIIKKIVLLIIVFFLFLGWDNAYALDKNTIGTKINSNIQFSEVIFSGSNIAQSVIDNKEIILEDEFIEVGVIQVYEDTLLGEKTGDSPIIKDDFDSTNEAITSDDESLLFDTTDSEESLDPLSDIKSDSIKTIKELETNIEALEGNKKILHTQFNDFVDKRGDLKEFFRDNLVTQDYVLIEKAINVFIVEKIRLDALLEEEAAMGNSTQYVTDGIVENKKNLYNSLRLFIGKESLGDYDNYANADISVTDQDSQIKSNIYKKTEILNTKVTTIKEKIQENERQVQLKLNDAVAEKVIAKLEIFLSNPQLQSLSQERQKAIFEKVLERVVQIKEEKIEEGLSLKTSKKILIYTVVEDVLIDFIKTNYSL